MRLTVLGSSASYPAAGRACAGYLLQAGGIAVLLDAGNGVLSNLQTVFDPFRLDAIFVTHGHPDHFADLFALQAMLRYGPEGPAPAMPVHAPHGLMERVGCILSDHGREEFAKAFLTEPMTDGATLHFEDLAITPRLVDHEGETFALVAEHDGSRLCYTADTRGGPAVLRAAGSADVLLAEATLPQAYAGQAPHMTGRDAGRLAARSGACRLVLTHLWPTASRQQILEDARKEFSGEVILAEEMLAIDI
jgi:ribonuclease BN (tRNA processing enzyme)